MLAAAVQSILPLQQQRLGVLHTIAGQHTRRLLQTQSPRRRNIAFLRSRASTRIYRAGDALNILRLVAYGFQIVIHIDWHNDGACENVKSGGTTCFAVIVVNGRLMKWVSPRMVPCTVIDNRFPTSVYMPGRIRGCGRCDAMAPERRENAPHPLLALKLNSNKHSAFPIETTDCRTY